ncbi:MAG TPA: Hsp20/alpha crystallin family protein [Gemmatimonadaceae bacterium]|nr:Hsp20/alpha crystallin family protein [Gemmatimonadaceae bacterium]
MATRGNKTEDRSSTRNANASGTKRDNATTASNQQSRGVSSQSSSNAGGANSASTSASRGDQQRDLQTTQERGSARPSSSPRRGDLEQKNRFPTISSLAGSSPFSVMRRMMEDMDWLFSGFSASQQPEGQQSQLRGGGERGLQSLTRGLWAPQVEVFERGKNMVVRAELPGLTRDDVDVEVEDDLLVIRGERHNDIEDEHDGYYRTERSYGSFYRAIPLPEGVDTNACNATFKDGVLEVTLPQPTPQVSKAKKINVR